MIISFYNSSIVLYFSVEFLLVECCSNDMICNRGRCNLQVLLAGIGVYVCACIYIYIGEYIYINPYTAGIGGNARKDGGACTSILPCIVLVVVLVRVAIEVVVLVQVTVEVVVLVQ